MRITIEKISPDLEEEVVVRCHEPSADWVGFIQCIKSEEKGIVGEADGEIFRLNLDEVYYFEVVDRKAFIYYRDKVYESRLRLYEFEEKCRGTAFFRASKSMIVNADKIDRIAPSLSGRFTATLLNGEKVIVSRQYVSSLKEILGL
ncbi:MAG: LytTR family DNA-binding domain-containing protein [Oscillospiraceae bacterium]